MCGGKSAIPRPDRRYQMRVEAIGNEMETVVPLPSSLVSVIVPPCCSTI